MPKALITGVAGFIGSHVADHCLRSGLEVVGIDDLSGGFVENVSEEVSFYQGDFSDQSFVKEIWRSAGPFEYVYHLGAYAAEGLSHFIRNYNYRTNVIGSVNLINEAVIHDTERFVFASSIAVYGANQTPMTEDMWPTPEDPYGIAKMAVELDLAAANKMFGLDYTIFRPHNVYGERQNIADKYRNVIGIFMNQLLSGESMTIFGDGSQTRAFSHIDDVAPYIADCVNNSGAENETFNIGADTPYTVLELAGEVAKALDKRCDVKYLDARNEVVHAFSDHAKLRNIFNVAESISLDAGIKRMAEWVLDRGQRSPVSFEDIEVHKNLPASWG
ncbi:NAD-dependent epimerase/dehydratase family protein [Spiribacter roseus]|uniref:NAD-dependent epimerase/dehydratase family protein n=1 Tax=Spiribacter roseus TaxID=1855875 RepID=UPI001330862B|nr:NAD-dependent epimerase/dehydratase family protein [Spiribacter roseus]KAF0284733.1 UDP-glucose 4-epimerase [Spiribacter roseus]